MRLPLPHDYFVCTPLPRHEIDRIKKIARDSIVQVVEYTRQGAKSRIEWTLELEESYVKVFKGHDPMAPPGVSTWLAQSTIRATINDVAAMFYCDSTDAYKTYIRTFYDELKDGLKLYSVVTPTPEAPRHFIGVNWVAQELPTNGLVLKNRDWCFVECQHDYVIDGRRVGLCQAMGFVRAEHYRSGMVYMETDEPGVLQVVQLNQVSLHGGLKVDHIFGDFGHHYGFKRRYKTMALKIERALRVRRLGAAASDATDAASTHCKLCLKRFGLLSKRAACSRCGEVICRRPKCSTASTNDEAQRACAVCLISPGPANIRSTASLLLLDDDNSSFLSQHSKVSSDVEQVPVQEPVLSYSQFDLKLTSDDDGNIFNSSRQLFV
ncbi:hypothetical protein Ae201684P_002933 [Aphanomyces euteiches]|nr:hypothetical protein Ae201684P_002933 [Aphanomyces euteiches]